MFKKLLLAILSLFKTEEKTEKPIDVVIKEEAKIEVPPKSTGKIKRIALLVGHGAGDSGAIGWNKVEEHAYNSFVAEYVSKQSLGKDIRVFYKASSGGWGPTYIKVGIFNPDLTIELHLNATEGAVGCEVLVLKSKEVSATIGRKFASEFCAKFNRKLRRDKGILWISSGDRGYGNLIGANAMSPLSILVEPFFIDTKSEWIAQEEYAKFLADFIKNV
jgi:N-acetylmuramoyl-L-alanine amidase